MLGLAAAAGALMAGSAGADVKSGADAWARGDYAGAIREWQGPADKGDPDAQFNLAQAYRLGRGVPQDLAKAEDLFGRAAAQGHLQAADNYGLLLFDRGERVRAMPYVQAAADRGDPRGQYLVGIAHFNGELVRKDWKRAYAYMTLANAAGLAQAAPALTQMDSYIPLAERQAAASLANDLAQKVTANRASQLASADLALLPAPTGTAPRAVVPTRAPSVTPPLVVPDAAVPSAVRTAGADRPATAGADFARPAVTAGAAAPKPASAKPGPANAAPAKPAPVKPAPAAPSGPWRVQLGAFGVAANADALWARAKARPELAGHPRISVRSGAVTKLQAGGFASRQDAAAACTGLVRAGFTCLPAQD